MDSLVVSALYNLKSKKSFNKYVQRMINFVNSCSSNIVIFTTYDNLEYIPKLDRIHSVILPISDWYSNNIATDDEFEAQRILYKESIGHIDVSIDLIKIYHEKYNFVNRAIQLFPQYEYYVWTDIGCIQEHHTDINMLIKSYPTITCKERLGNKICFTLVKPIDQEVYERGVSTDIGSSLSYIAGGIILGNKTAWSNFDSIYKSTLNYFKSNSLFWASDEHIYLYMLCKNPTEITAIETFHNDIYVGMPNADYKWIAFFIILNLSYTRSIQLFNHNFKNKNGFPNVQKALWFSESNSLDVTETIRNIKILGPILLKYTLFKNDPHPCHSKKLYIEYENGIQYVIPENDVFSLLPPVNN